MENLRRDSAIANWSGFKRFAFLIPVFIIGLFFLFKPTLFGTDSFYYWGVECHGLTFSQHSFWFKDLIDLLGCNLLAFKLASLFLLGLTSYILVLIAEHFDKENGWLAGVFVFLSLMWGTKFLLLEPELVAWPFLFLGFLFLLRGVWAGVIVSWLAGLALWKGALFFFVGMAGLFPPLLVFPLVAVVVEPSLVTSNLLWLSVPLDSPLFVSENLPAIGLIAVGFCFFGMFGIKRHRELLFPTLIFLGLGFLSAKFVFPVVAFLAINLAINWKELAELLNSKNVDASIFMVGLIAINVLLAGWSVWATNPSTQDVEAVEFAIDINENVQTSWGVGNWVQGMGGIPSNVFGGAINSFLCDGRPILTYEDLNAGFKLEKDFGKYKVYSC